MLSNGGGDTPSSARVREWSEPARGIVFRMYGGSKLREAHRGIALKYVRQPAGGQGLCVRRGQRDQPAAGDPAQGRGELGSWRVDTGEQTPARSASGLHHRGMPGGDVLVAAGHLLANAAGRVDVP